METKKELGSLLVTVNSDNDYTVDVQGNTELLIDALITFFMRDAHLYKHFIVRSLQAVVSLVDHSVAVEKDEELLDKVAELKRRISDER